MRRTKIQIIIFPLFCNNWIVKKRLICTNSRRIGCVFLNICLHFIFIFKIKIIMVYVWPQALAKKSEQKIVNPYYLQMLGVILYYKLGVKEKRSFFFFNSNITIGFWHVYHYIDSLTNNLLDIWFVTNPKFSYYISLKSKNLIMWNVYDLCYIINKYHICTLSEYIHLIKIPTEWLVYHKSISVGE